ncbi:hypothetical protein JW960_19640 [candidate division KSB1 bacterium]|nr:hypothetical protein [candidate division KSB1 bacterium]
MLLKARLILWLVKSRLSLIPVMYATLNDGSTLTCTNLANNGTGKNYGIKFTIEKFLNNGWYFLSTNSIYQAKYKA